MGVRDDFSTGSELGCKNVPDEQFLQPSFTDDRKHASRAAAGHVLQPQIDGRVLVIKPRLVYSDEFNRWNAHCPSAGVSGAKMSSPTNESTSSAETA